MPTTPILVVGAGPAGATAARTLAAAGLPVCLLDRSSFPRNKPCGGGISARVLTRFPYLQPALRRITTHAVARLRLEGPDGDSTVVESDAPGGADDPADRIRRPARLSRRRSRRGAGDRRRRRSGVGRTRSASSSSPRDGRRFEAPLVVAADGVHSVIASRLGLNRGWPASSVALDMMEETPRSALRDIDPSTMWVAYGYEPQKFNPESAQDAGESLGDLCALAAARPRKATPTSSRSAITSTSASASCCRTTAMRSSRAVRAATGLVAELRERGVMTGESVRRNFTPFLIPVGGPLRRPGRGRVLLAGDAGGFVNGVHGRRHLLRDGVRRSGGARHHRDGRGRPGSGSHGDTGARAITKLAASCGIPCWCSAICSPIAAESRRLSQARIVNAATIRLCSTTPWGVGPIAICGAVFSCACRWIAAG